MRPHSGPASRIARSAALLAVGLAVPASLALASSAQAYEIKDFSANIVQADGTTFESQAGAVPYQGVISFNTVANQDLTNPPIVEQAGSTRQIRLTVPEGLVPNPEAIPECNDQQLHDRTCPTAAQVGVVELRLRSYLPFFQALALPQGSKGWLRISVPLYNMERSNGSQLARFAFDSSQAPNATTGHVTEIIGDMRPDDNRLFFTINDVVTPTATNPTQPLLAGATMRFWGKPNATAHNAQRGVAGLQLTSIDSQGTFTGNLPFPDPPYQTGNAVPPNVPLGFPIGLPTPSTGQTGITNPDATFLRSPTSCAGPQKAELRLTSWQGQVRDAEVMIGESTNGLQGCDQVPFAANTTFGPSSMQADAPVPLGVTLDVPQSGDSDPLATAHVKDVKVTLPPGMTISPSAAHGLEACTDAQFAQGTNDPIGCSAASRIGDVTISTPVLPANLTGSVHVGQPLPGNRYRLFVNADGFGISIRLKGDVRPDPVTGQVTAYFTNNPQLPFSQFKLDFNGGSRAIIASPQACGTHAGTSLLSPWSGNAAVQSDSSVTVTGCNGNIFAPGFSISPASFAAGAQAPLTVDIARPDTQQTLSGVDVRLPKGLLASIRGVEQCTEAQMTAIACPAGSRIGTVSVKAGPGATPYELSGPVYLTPGYNGGSFGAVVIIHAVAGPYDLGHVVVRQSLRIDPVTAQVTVVSDPLPQIIEGIPLRLRHLRLNVDRAGFMRNPTSCATDWVDATLTSAAGASSRLLPPLQFADCAKLAFSPRITMGVRGRSQMGRFRYPSLRATVTQAAGQAGIRSSRVTLPRHLALAAKNAQGLCEVKQAEADQCPKSSIVGYAVATTPLLNQPLRGPIYFVKGERTNPTTGRVISTLPTFYVPLRGETTIHLRATTAVDRRDQLVTTFPAVPDAPITRFEFNISGGKNGIIQATRNLCSSSAFRANVRFRGQNGANPKALTPRISTDCRRR